MKTVLRFFNSIRLAIALLIILAVASVVGTLIPQGWTVGEYTLRYGPLATLLIRLQFTALYHSVWYKTFLGLFALNIIICTLTRLSPKIRRATRPHIDAEAKSLLALKHKDRWKRAAPLATAESEVEHRLKAARYRVRTSVQGPKTSLLARKKVLGLFGSDAVHVGLLIIIAGGIVSGLSSARTQLSFNEGDIRPVPGAGFDVRLDKFATEYYPDGSVKDWKSTLTVLQTGRPVVTKVVEVNHPLTCKGYSFYQANYGYNWDHPTVEVWVKKKSDAGFLKKLKLKIDEREGLDDKEQTVIAVQKFLPDFILGEGNTPVNRSDQPNNPAAQIEGYQAGVKVFTGWVFANYPDFAQMHAANDPSKSGPTDLSFELKSFDAAEFSVIEAAHDPGTNFIWLGCLFVMAGFALAFYWPTWEIRVALEESQGKTDVIAGGLAAKSKEAFASEFARIAADLRRPS